MHYIYFATSIFGARILEEMLDAGMPPSALVTMPDSIAGRGHQQSVGPAKRVALQAGIPILQPKKLNAAALMDLRVYPVDLYLVAAYGAIIPKTIFDFPKFKTLNVHPSLLPQYRGPSPIQSAILSGERKTGVSIILIDEKVDHGPLLARESATIESDDTAASLEEKLAVASATLLTRVMPRWMTHAIKAVPQQHGAATMTAMLTKEDGHLDWSHDAAALERRVRAMHPWPGAWSIWSGKKKQRLRILKACVQKNTHEGAHGTVLPLDGGALPVHCNNGALGILELQREGKKPMTAIDFVNGSPGIVGAVLR